MVELSRTFLQQRLSRQPPAATLVGVPQQVRVPDDSGLAAQAGAALARGLQATSQVFTHLAERNLRLKNAQETAQTNQAMGEFQLGLAPVMQGIAQENVPLLERPEALRARGQELIDGLLDTVPQRLQSTFKAAATQQLARFVLLEQSSTSQQFVTEQHANIPALLSLRARELVSADESQLPALKHGLSVLASTYVDSGIITRPLADALVQESIDRALTERTQLAIITQPERMLGHLEDLANGGPGAPGLPVPPHKELLTLVRTAQMQVAQDVARFEADERIASRRLAQQQDAERIRLQDRLYKPDLTLDEARRIGAEIRTAGEQRLLTPEDHGILLRDHRAVEHALVEGPAVTDPETKRTMLINLHSDLGGKNLDTLRRAVVEGMTEGKINSKDAQSWLQEIDRQRQANYYTNIPAYKEGRQFLDQAVNYLNNIYVLSDENRAQVEQLQTRVAYALQSYSQEIRALWDQEGVRGVENRAQTIANEVATFFAVTPRSIMDFFPEPEVLRQVPAGVSVDERYTQAFQRLGANQRLTDAEKQAQYRLLRLRQTLETQVERFETSQSPGARRVRESALPPPSVAPQGSEVPSFTTREEMEHQKQRLQ